MLLTVSIPIRQPFSSHSQHRRFNGDLIELFDLHPAQRVRVITDSKIFAADDAKSEPRIEMMMGRIVATRRDQMDIDIEQLIIEGLDGETRFFARFATCDAQRIGVTVAVSAQL